MGSQEGGATVEPALRNVSDTARMVAMFRALESERPDALFKDPFARRLAGPRGEKILQELSHTRSAQWSVVTRTLLLDEMVLRGLKEGVDTVVNLAAGLDTRPYRLALPSTLRWIEVDLPGILDEKERGLAGEKPGCELERVPLDLTDAAERRALFERIDRDTRRALILSEGLLMYLKPSDVGALAEALALPPSFRFWAFDLLSPKVLQLIQQQWKGTLGRANAMMHFAPPEGVEFFGPHGWKVREMQSMLKRAAGTRRLSLWMRLMALLPDPKGPRGERQPWSSVCLLEQRQARSPS